MKTKILTAINTVTPLQDYHPTDCIFSQKYPLSPAAWVYVLLALTKEFNFTINDDFVDALKECTFEGLEKLLAPYA